MSSRDHGYTKAAKKQEEELAYQFGAKRVPGSGAGLHYKDDVAAELDVDLAANKRVRIEAKGTASTAYSLEARTWLRTWKQSIAWEQTPIVVVKFRRGYPDASDWAFVDPLAVPELPGCGLVVHDVWAQSIQLWRSELEALQRADQRLHLRWVVSTPRYAVRPSLVAVPRLQLQRIFNAR